MREFPFPLFPVSSTFLATEIPAREISQFPPKKQRNELLKYCSERLIFNVSQKSKTNTV